MDIRRRKGRGREDHHELLSGDAARQAQEEGASMHAVAGWGGMSSGDDAAPKCADRSDLPTWMSEQIEF